MAKLRVTMDVDTTKLFDTLHEIDGNCAPLGERLASILMTGEASFKDDIGLALYGVNLQEVKWLEK